MSPTNPGKLAPTPVPHLRRRGESPNHRSLHWILEKSTPVSLKAKGPGLSAAGHPLIFNHSSHAPQGPAWGPFFCSLAFRTMTSLASHMRNTTRWLTQHLSQTPYPCFPLERLWKEFLNYPASPAAREDHVTDSDQWDISRNTGRERMKLRFPWGKRESLTRQRLPSLDTDWCLEIQQPSCSLEDKNSILRMAAQEREGAWFFVDILVLSLVCLLLNFLFEKNLKYKWWLVDASVG